MEDMKPIMEGFRDWAKRAARALYPGARNYVTPEMAYRAIKKPNKANMVKLAIKLHLENAALSNRQALKSLAALSDDVNEDIRDTLVPYLPKEWRDLVNSATKELIKKVLTDLYYKLPRGQDDFPDNWKGWG